MNTSFVNEKILPAVTKFANFKFIKAVQSAVIAGLGPTIVGSIFMIMMQPPFPAEMHNAFIDGWRAFSGANIGWLSLGYTVTMNFVGLFTVVGMAIAVAEMNKIRPTNMVAMSVACFTLLVLNFGPKGLDLAFYGAQGLITALLVGYFVVEISCFLMKHGLKVKLPDSVPPFVAEPLNAMFVNIIVIALAVVVRIACAVLGHGMLLPQVINKCFEWMFICGDTLIAATLYSVIVRVLWFFGIHGSSIGNIVMAPLLSVTMIENANAYTAGKPLPYILTSSFTSTWTVMGILAIALSMLIFCRSKQLQSIARVAIAPALFNIGEPITFGLPIVMNFKIFVPYIICFALDAAVPYLATAWGLMNRSFVGVPYTVPAVFKVFLSTMDWRAIVVYVLLMIGNILIFAPWLKRYDKELLAKEKE